MRNVFDEALVRAKGSETLILSNGSKWLGDSPDSIEVLKDNLRNETLDSKFDGLFHSYWRPFVEVEEKMKPFVGAHHFFGNFRRKSAVFSVLTTDKKLANELLILIAQNKRRPDYKN